MAITNKSKKIKKSNSKEKIMLSVLKEINKLDEYDYGKKFKILNDVYLKYNLIFPNDVDFLMYTFLIWSDYIKYLIEENENKISNEKILFLKKLYNESLKQKKCFYNENECYRDKEGNII